MSLTCEKLMEFNLSEEAERELFKDPTNISKFVSLHTDIENIDRFIKDTPSFPRSTDKIRQSELKSVIGATLSIEGTSLNQDEIEESFKKADEGTALRRKEQEAENSRKVYRSIKDLVNGQDGNIEYSEAVIKQIHKYFTENMNYISNTPGDYRHDFNVSFGEPRKSSLCRTRIETENTMKKFVAWLNTEEKGFLNGIPFVKAMMAHYYLTEIHPFGDGNGRTARALEALVLYSRGVNDYCFWSWANFWSSHKDQYLFHLHEIRRTLNPLSFILWGLEGYRDEISDIKNKVLKKVKQLMFSDYVHYLLRNKKREKIKINQRIVDVLQLLILHDQISLDKFLSSPEIVAYYRNVNRSTRTLDFKKMVRAELIHLRDDDTIMPNYQILDHLTFEVR